jgi:hypothetical protein
MNLQEIRDLMHKKGAYTHANKQVMCDWMRLDVLRAQELTLGLTLVPKKVDYKHVRHWRNGRMVLIKKQITKDELEQATRRFIHALNKTVYGKHGLRKGTKLCVIYTIEGDKKLKDRHVHMAFNKAKHLSWWEMARCVERAIQICSEFMTYDEICSTKYDTFLGDDEAFIEYCDSRKRYKLDLINDGWITYITKDMDKHTVDELVIG